MAFVIFLTTLTFYSTEILTAIFGNGLAPVRNELQDISIFFQGEDPDAWWKEIEPRTNPNPAEDESMPMDEVSQKQLTKSGKCI